MPVKFARSFTISTGYGCPSIAGVERHRRHIDGTPATPECPAIYATYAIYGPPMVSADATLIVPFGSTPGVAAPCPFRLFRFVSTSLFRSPISKCGTPRGQGVY